MYVVDLLYCTTEQALALLNPRAHVLNPQTLKSYADLHIVTPPPPKKKIDLKGFFMNKVSIL